MILARKYYQIFFQESTHYARAEITANGSLKYVTEKGIPDLALIQDHIDEKNVLGAYTVSPGDTIRWLAWDIDSKLGLDRAREIARRISDFLREKDIPHAIEFSGGKGYHIWLFFKDKESAALGKELGERLRDYFGFAKGGQIHVEVFPKQAHIDDQAGEVGSLLRLPLGKHPKTGNKAVFCTTTDWEEGVILDPEEVFEKTTTLSALEEALSDLDPSDQIANLLAPYWSDGQRHDITLCTAGMVLGHGWTQDQAKELVKIIHSVQPQGDLKDQLKAVETTYERHAEGKSVLGENGLASFIPGAVLMKIRTLMGEGTASLILQTLDAIRLAKNPSFVKVRDAANAIISYLIQNGRLVRDDNNVYWLNYEDHQLIMIDTYSWQRTAHNLLGINQAESFGRQVAEAIRHLAYKAAKVVTVVKRSHWTNTKNGKEYINLGGKEIYVLDGKEITVVYNGEIDVLFLNADDTMCLPNLLEEDDMIDPWSLLVDDVNFSDGDVSMEQQKQLLIACICSMFFPEAMPTRPILMILGDAGSGKTTTARRILWCIEGTKEDVLGQVPDKPDALRASMAAHRMIVLDNIEKTSVRWLPDVLNRAATGSQVEVRELHTTNRVQKIIFNVFMCLTGTEIPFSEEAVYTRILPINLSKLTNYLSEGVMRSNISNNFNAFWKGMLFELNKIVAQLNENTDTNFPSETRLADFAVFCNRIKGADFIDEENLMKGLSNLVDRQKEILIENTPFIGILDGLIKTRPDEMSGSMTANELYAKAQRYAAHNNQRFDWGTPQALSKHILMLEPQLKKHYGLSVKTDREAGREIKKYKFIVVASTATTNSDSQEKMN